MNLDLNIEVVKSGNKWYLDIFEDDDIYHAFSTEKQANSACLVAQLAYRKGIADCQEKIRGSLGITNSMLTRD